MSTADATDEDVVDSPATCAASAIEAASVAVAGAIGSGGSVSSSVATKSGGPMVIRGARCPGGP